MQLPILPRNIRRIGDVEEFAFACRPGVSCFTDCCRQLELALTPYDVLRLKNSLQMHSSDFLERYVIVEQDDADVFPRFYLTMVDDGNASCVFVTSEGCTVYRDRPGACRAYPLGRAVRRREDGSMEDFFVLLCEEHCRGFEQSPTQTPVQYGKEQGLENYNKMNDALGALLQHRKIREGMRLTRDQVALFTLALYDLDTFRKKVFSDGAENNGLPAPILHERADDEKLLLYGINWLRKRFFDEEDEELC